MKYAKHGGHIDPSSAQVSPLAVATADAALLIVHSLPSLARAVAATAAAAAASLSIVHSLPLPSSRAPPPPATDRKMDNSGPNKVRLDDRKFAMGAAAAFLVSFLIFLIVGITGPEVFIRHYGRRGTGRDVVLPVSATTVGVKYETMVTNMRPENQLLWCARAPSVLFVRVATAARERRRRGLWRRVCHVAAASARGRRPRDDASGGGGCQSPHAVAAHTHRRRPNCLA